MATKNTPDRPWTRKEEAEAVRLRRAGLKVHAIGRALNRSRSALTNKFHLLGALRTRPKGGLRAEVRRLWAAGYADKRAAAVLGVGRSNVTQARLALGLPSQLSRGLGGMAADGEPGCFACGLKCPARTHAAGVGWASRRMMVNGCRVTELMCPECFARWGWGEDIPA